MTIHITAEAIKRGNHFPESCPVASAIKDATGRRVKVTVQGVWLYGREIPLPYEAVRWLWRYDARQPVEPISFELELESEDEE